MGYLIVYGGQVFQLDLVMTGVIILAIVAAIIYEAIVLSEKIVMKKCLKEPKNKQIKMLLIGEKYYK